MQNGPSKRNEEEPGNVAQSSVSYSMSDTANSEKSEGVNPPKHKKMKAEARSNRVISERKILHMRQMKKLSFHVKEFDAKVILLNTLESNGDQPSVSLSLESVKPTRTGKHCAYVIFTTGGLERLCYQEVKSVLGARIASLEIVKSDRSVPADEILTEAKRHYPSTGIAGCGKLIVRSHSVIESRIFLGIRSILCVSLLVANVRVGMERSALAKMRKVVAAADWNKILETWCHYNPSFDQKSIVRVRATCTRKGKHKYTSVDVASHIGGSPLVSMEESSRYKLEIDLVNFDLELICVLLGQHLIVGVALSSKSKDPALNNAALGSQQYRRDGIEIVSGNNTATLRANVAYMLAVLGNPAPGDVVADIMGGFTVGCNPASSSGSLRGRRHFGYALRNAMREKQALAPRIPSRDERIIEDP